jgi:tetratricopeptide (TPR) repeat protein
MYDVVHFPPKIRSVGAPRRVQTARCLDLRSSPVSSAGIGTHAAKSLVSLGCSADGHGQVATGSIITLAAANVRERKHTRPIRHNVYMTGTVTTIIPAAAALAGVFLAQLWSAWQDRFRYDREVSKQLWSERSKSIFQFLKALNVAKDDTRKILFAGYPVDKLKAKDRESEPYWSNAYEAYLEICLLLPGYPERLAWCTLQAAYIWRRQSIRLGKSVGSVESHYESFIEQLRPWLQITAKQRRLNRLANSSSRMLYLADRLDEIGYELAQVEDYSASRHNLREAVELRRKLARRDPASTVALVRSLDILGADLVQLGREKEALATWGEAISLAESMAYDQPNASEYARYGDLKNRYQEVATRIEEQ